MVSSSESPPSAPVRVVIGVRGGVAELIFKPKGIEVAILDYDVEGVTPVDQDPDGRPCLIQSVAAGARIVANKHWPLVHSAARQASEHTQQRWRCPQCGRTVLARSDRLAHVGTPMCHQCESEMEPA